LLLYLIIDCGANSLKEIADFGFAKIVEGKGSLKTQCGTPVSGFYLHIIWWLKQFNGGRGDLI